MSSDFQLAEGDNHEERLCAQDMDQHHRAVGERRRLRMAREVPAGERKEDDQEQRDVPRRGELPGGPGDQPEEHEEHAGAQRREREHVHESAAERGPRDREAAGQCEEADSTRGRCDSQAGDGVWDSHE